MDIWSAAGHAHHPDTCMECWLLPCSVSAEVEEETPLVEERRQMQAMQARRRASALQRFVLAQSTGCKSLIQSVYRRM